MDQDLKDTLTGLLSRKFIISVIALFLIVFALPIDADKKAEMIVWLVGIFSAANVTQKIGVPSKTTTTETTVTDEATTQTKTETPTGEKMPPG